MAEGSFDPTAVNDLIHELRNAGAEAIAIDDIRITADVGRGPRHERDRDRRRAARAVASDRAPSARRTGCRSAIERPGGILSLYEQSIDARFTVSAGRPTSTSRQPSATSCPRPPARSSSLLRSTTTELEPVDAMKDLIERALDAAQRGGASYADVRVVERETRGPDRQERRTRGGQLQLQRRIRRPRPRRRRVGLQLERDARRRGGRARSRARRSRSRAPPASPAGRRSSSTTRRPSPTRTARRYDEDPFAVSLDDKLRDPHGRRCGHGPASRASPSARGTWSPAASARPSRRWPARGSSRRSSRPAAGSRRPRSTIRRCSSAATRTRSAARSVTGGFEAVRALDLADHAQETAELAVALLDAPQCPSGEMDLILDSTQVALQIHESCGHPTELDRVYGTEASFAGTSFLTTDKLDRSGTAAIIVSIDADATAPGGLGTFGYDDEGVPAQKRAAHRSGTLVGYLTSRETAPRIGRRSMGSARALDVEQHPAHPHDEHQPAPRRRGQPRGSHRRYARWHLHERQQELVDRRSAPELPVRRPGRLAHQERQADAAGEEPDLHRHHARSSGAAATRSAAPTSGRCGGCRTAARASRSRPATSAMGQLPRDSAA